MAKVSIRILIMRKGEVYLIENKINSKTQIINAHSFDYDLFLKSDKNYGDFII